MKPSIHPLGTLLVAFCGLTQCVMPPPMPPPVAATGFSLDAPPQQPAGQPTRYLEPTPGPPLPDTPPSAIADAGGALRYQTPADIDPSLQTGQNPTPPSTPGSMPPPPVPTTPNSPVTDTAASTSPAETPPAVTPPPATKPGTPEQMPFGLPVPGKKGFVYSPFDKAQMVDVRGIPPGKKVRCPYTSKIFLVP